MGRKRKTFVQVIVSKPGSRIEVNRPDLEFEGEATELMHKMAGEPVVSPTPTPSDGKI